MFSAEQSAKSPEDLPFVESLSYGGCWIYIPSGDFEHDFSLGKHFCRLAVDYMSRQDDHIFFRRLLDDLHNSPMVSGLEEGFFQELCATASRGLRF